jgi:pyrroloquinoline quinone (PQQ) biosynthesis protein C
MNAASSIVIHNFNTSFVKHEVALSLLRIERHPFVIRAKRGDLTYQEALRWIMCAGRESRTFPTILENMIADCIDPVIRKILQDNLDDEYGNGNIEHAHFNHYLQLLDKLGIQRQQFEGYHERSGIRLALDLALSVSSSKNIARALGYMVVNEGMTPITYSAIKSGLMQFHPDLKTDFFDMHIIVDEKHVADLHRAIEELPEQNLEDVLFGICIGERGMAVLLDEVIGVYG